MQKQQYEIHPAATLFPMMTEEEYAGLKEDIAENGQREDIVVWCNQVIDGRNRLRACEELGREPSIAELDEDQDPWKYVISHNLHRRHLTTSQRAMVASKMAKLKHGTNQHKKEELQNCNSSSLEDAAGALSVSKRSVMTAKTVQERASDDVKEAVENGTISVSLGAKLADVVPDKEQQTEILKQGVKAVRDAVKDKNPTKPKQQRERKIEEPVWEDVVDEDDDLAGKAVAEFKKLWNKCDATGKRAIRVWLDENYLD